MFRPQSGKATLHESDGWRPTAGRRRRVKRARNNCRRHTEFERTDGTCEDDGLRWRVRYTQ